MTRSSQNLLKFFEEVMISAEATLKTCKYCLDSNFDQHWPAWPMTVKKKQNLKTINTWMFHIIRVPSSPYLISLQFCTCLLFCLCHSVVNYSGINLYEVSSLAFPKNILNYIWINCCKNWDSTTFVQKKILPLLIPFLSHIVFLEEMQVLSQPHDNKYWSKDSY